jgi:hypothetical protein
MMAVIPQKNFSNWLSQLVRVLEIEVPVSVENLTEDELYMNCALFMVPAFDSNEACNAYINEHYKAIFINCLYMWCQDNRFWPNDFKEKLTLDIFKQYFQIELHSRFYAMSSEISRKDQP